MPRSKRRYVIASLAALAAVFLYGSYLVLDEGFACCADSPDRQAPESQAETSDRGPSWRVGPTFVRTGWTVRLTGPAYFRLRFFGEAPGAAQYWLTLQNDKGRVLWKYEWSRLGDLSLGGFCSPRIGPGERLRLRIVPVSADGVRGEEQVLEFTAPTMSVRQHVARAAYDVPRTLALTVWVLLAWTLE